MKLYINDFSGSGNALYFVKSSLDKAKTALKSACGLWLILPHEVSSRSQVHFMERRALDLTGAWAPRQRDAIM